MIHVHRLNDAPLWVSADQVEFLEATPDTVISLLSGRKVIVKESVDDVVDRIVAYKRKFHLPPDALVDKRGKEIYAPPVDGR